MGAGEAGQPYPKTFLTGGFESKTFQMVPVRILGFENN
jgi:hypothetical protein